MASLGQNANVDGALLVSRHHGDEIAIDVPRFSRYAQVHFAHGQIALD